MHAIIINFKMLSMLSSCLCATILRPQALNVPFYSNIVIIIFAIDEDNEIEDKFECMAKDSKKGHSYLNSHCEASVS